VIEEQQIKAAAAEVLKRERQAGRTAMQPHNLIWWLVGGGLVLLALGIGWKLLL
jgi:hypothetical protein